MKHLCFFLLSVFLSPLLSSAQSNYKPGYVVTLKGDTLKGFIDYQEWDSNPTSIDFKGESTLKAYKKLTTGDISFFNVDNIETYQTYSGRISEDRIDADHVNYGKDTSFKNASVFLKILEKGDKITLLSYTDAQRSHFYIQEKSASHPTELVYSIYIIEDLKTGNNKTINEDAFKRQLYAAAQKYDRLTDRLQVDMQRADYKKSDILKIVSTINNMTESGYITKRNYKNKSDLFITAGVNFTTNSPTAGSPFTTSGGEAHTSSKPVITLGTDIFVNPNTRQLFFRMEIGLAQSTYKLLYVDKVSPYTSNQTSFDELWISFTPQVGYNVYNGENFKFYLAAGIAFTFYKHSNEFFGTAGSSIYSTDVFNFNPFDNPLLLKAGVQLNKRIGIYGAYLSSVGTTRGGYFALSKTAEQIALKYTFK